MQWSCVSFRVTTFFYSGACMYTFILYILSSFSWFSLKIFTTFYISVLRLSLFSSYYKRMGIDCVFGSKSRRKRWKKEDELNPHVFQTKWEKHEKSVCVFLILSVYLCIFSSTIHSLRCVILIVILFLLLMSYQTFKNILMSFLFSSAFVIFSVHKEITLLLKKGNWLFERKINNGKKLLHSYTYYIVYTKTYYFVDVCFQWGLFTLTDSLLIIIFIKYFI